MKKLLLGIILIGILSLISGCVEYDIRTVDAKVYDKHYKASWIETYLDDDPEYISHSSGYGKYHHTYTTTIHHYHYDHRYHPAQYWVYFKYEDLTQYVENKELYQRMGIGCTFRASVHEGYDSKGKLVNRYLTEYEAPTRDKNRDKIKSMKY